MTVAYKSAVFFHRLFKIIQAGKESSCNLWTWLLHYKNAWLVYCRETLCDTAVFLLYSGIHQGKWACRFFFLFSRQTVNGRNV